MSDTNESRQTREIPAPPSTQELPGNLRVLDRGWLSSTNTLCLGGQPALIDTGHMKHATATLARLRPLLGEQPLACIAHTHLHSDHCGGTALLQEVWPNALSLVPIWSLQDVQNWNAEALSYQETGQRCTPFRATGGLQPGQETRLGDLVWQVHAAPGHDNKAVFLFNPEHRIVVAGDALWEQGVGVIFPELDGFDAFAAFADTLDRIENLQPEWVIPGHGPAFSRADGRIRAALAQARRRIAGFRADPTRHAQYAAKVMIKYQMLDVEQMPLPAFRTWLRAASILQHAHQRYWPQMPWDDWIESLLQSLLERGALERSDGCIRNGAG